MNSLALDRAHGVTSRPYTGERDLEDMLGLLMQARSLAGDWRYWHVGDLMWGFFMVACHLNPQEHIRLWHAGDKLVGYAMLGEDPAFDYQVLPGYEWSGIETEALTWAASRLRQLREQDPQRWGSRLVSAARQDDLARIRLLSEHGFVRGGHDEWNLSRGLGEPVPEPVLPAGYRVRGIEDADVADRAAIERDVWLPYTVGNVSDDNYAYLMRLPGYHRDLDLVTLAPDGIIAANVNAWIDPVNHIGDFGPVGARPAFRRQGLTRAALLEGLRRMQARGMDRVIIATQRTNTPARRLYESIGFQIVNETLEFARSE